MKLWDFEGRWQIAREIDDRLAGRRGVFTGEAVFTRDGEGLAYHEEGVLEVAGVAPMRATRVYLWREGEGGIEVLFDDGRPFHGIYGIGATAHHWCDPDDYNVAYDFDAWPLWRAVWEVTGPRKDYRMVSRYDRIR